MFAGREITTRTAGVLVLAMVFGLTARAYGFAGGTGEPNDPYPIATVEDLLSIGSDRILLTRHYVLVNDLDLDPNLPGGRVFEDALIAPDQSEGVSSHSGEPFSGVLDGRGHTIRNLSIAGRRGYDAGLFGKLSGLVKDLNLQNVRISGSPCGAVAGLNHLGAIRNCAVIGQVSGSGDVGGIVGSLWDALLIDCRADVQVLGEDSVGGLVGGGPGGMLVRCTAQVEVRGNSNVGGLIGDLPEYQLIECGVAGIVVGVNQVGGLAGMLHRTALILRCTTDCEVVAERAAGGLVGDGHIAYGAWIMDSHAHGSVAGSPAGGLLGVAVETRIVNCYAACKMIPMTPASGTPVAAVGGLFGEANAFRPPLVIGCFWDTEVSGVPLSAGMGSQHPGAGLRTEQMQKKATFEQAGWDFGSTWAMSEGGYPVLQWEPAADAGR